MPSSPLLPQPLAVSPPRVIYFRPHHFLCALGFAGKGYSPAFVERFSDIIHLVTQVAPHTPIEVVEHTDDICQPCPNRLGLKCATQDKINQLDMAHQHILKLTNKEQLTFEQAKQRMAQYMTIDAFHRACLPCEWKRLGLCENALIKLHQISRL